LAVAGRLKNLLPCWDFILSINQEQLGITCKNDDYSLCFAELIRKASKKYGKKTVVLIDEYDKPILDTIDHPEIALECREILKEFYNQSRKTMPLSVFAFLNRGEQVCPGYPSSSGLETTWKTSAWTRPMPALGGNTQDGY